LDDKYYIIPMEKDGVELSEQDAVRMWQEGNNPAAVRADNADALMGHIKNHSDWVDSSIQRWSDYMQEDKDREAEKTRRREAIMDEIAISEGGYVNDPDDRGGETKYGISKKSYPNEDIPNLTPERAREIYKRDYWDKVKADMIPHSVQDLVFDMAINSGPSRAVKTLQRVVGAKEDGIMGPNTVDKIRMHGDSVRDDYVQARRDYYNDIVKRTPSQKKWINGWNARLDRMAKATYDAPSPKPQQPEQGLNKVKDWQEIAIEYMAAADNDYQEAFRLAQRARENGRQFDPDLAAAEHFLFSQGFSSEAPWNAAAMMLGTPAYALYKAAGFKPEATPPSFDQIQAGLAGAWSGLVSYFSGETDSVPELMFGAAQGVDEGIKKWSRPVMDYIDDAREFIGYPTSGQRDARIQAFQEGKLNNKSLITAVYAPEWKEDGFHADSPTQEDMLMEMAIGTVAPGVGKVLPKLPTKLFFRGVEKGTWKKAVELPREYGSHAAAGDNIKQAAIFGEAYDAGELLVIKPNKVGKSLKIEDEGTGFSPDTVIKQLKKKFPQDEKILDRLDKGYREHKYRAISEGKGPDGSVSQEAYDEVDRIQGLYSRVLQQFSKRKGYDKAHYANAVKEEGGGTSHVLFDIKEEEVVDRFYFDKQTKMWYNKNGEPVTLEEIESLYKDESGLSAVITPLTGVGIVSSEEEAPEIPDNGPPGLYQDESGRLFQRGEDGSLQDLGNIEEV